MFGGASQFTFGNTATSSPFGATSTTNTTPASTGFLFGSTSTPAMGTAAPTLNSTFTFGTPAANTAATAPTATQPLAFGAGLQNSSTIRPFGSTTAFGTAPAAAAPATGTTAFGGTSLFGATQTAPQPTSIFGSTGSTFGTTQPAQQTTMFGATATAAATQTGTTVRFEAVTSQDTMRTKNNTFQTISTKLQCVSAMKEYINKSMEELRMEDYQANRKFPAAGTTSLFGGSNFATPSPFSSTPYSGTNATFVTAPATSTATNIFGASNTTTASPFGATATSTSPFTFGTSAAPATNLFGTAAATTTASPFGTATSTAPATTSIFGATQATPNIFGATSAATTSPFGAKPVTTQSTFGFGTATSTPAPFAFGSQPATNTTLFPQPATTTNIFGSTAPAPTANIFGVATSTAAPTTTNMFGAQQAATNIFGATTSTAAPAFGAATTTPAFAGFGTTAAPGATTNIFGAPATSTATTAPIFGGFNTQPATSAPGLFSFSNTGTTAAPSLFGAPAATTTTTSSIFNPQPFTGFNLSQPQPAASTTTQPFSFATAPFGSTSAMSFGAPTATAMTQIQPQIVQQPSSIIQQRFLAASLLDPFASRGKKDFTNFDHTKPPTDLIVVSTSSNTTTTVTTSTSSPITLPLQLNSRKTSSARPLVDIRFKLKPISSAPSTSPIINEIKSPNQQPMTSIEQVKSPLTADFSEEEESLLIGRKKMSKLRLSNELNESSFQSESIRSLYPMRRLAELEKLANLNNNTNIISTGHNHPSFPSSSSTTTIDTASAYVSSTTVNNEQTLHPSNNNRGMLPLHHSTPLIGHKQPSPPVSQPLSTLVQSPNTSSPPPPRSSTPPPPTSAGSFSRTRPSIHSDTRAYQLPKLSRPDYYMRPSTAELKSLFNDKGQCIVKQFTVGHEKYGSVTFYGQVNVAGLDLDQIIEIDRHELTVYPDDSNKPPEGEELNIPARITLLGVFPIDRTTRQEIIDIDRIKAMNYGDYLSEVTKKFDGEFINYGINEGSWTFAVKHFTRYGLDGSEDDFVVVKPVQQKVINPNFLDQTIALNDTYALSSPKTQPMDMEEKENTRSSQPQPTVRFTNQSLIGLRPTDVEQLVQSMFSDDDDDDDFDGFPQATDQIKTSTKIIPSTTDFIPGSSKRTFTVNGNWMSSEPITEKSTTMEHETTQLTFNAPIKPVRERVYSKLPQQFAKIRGKYFRTNFTHQLQYASIDPFNETRLLLQTPLHFDQQANEDLEQFFELYFSSCIQQSQSSTNLPFFRVRQDDHVVQQFLEFYNKLIDEKSMDDDARIPFAIDYTLQILQLCHLLWGQIAMPPNIPLRNPTYFEQQKRRQMLSNWLHQCILSQPQGQKWANENCELLSRGLFKDCVKFARDEGDLRLSALVYAASGSSNVRDILRHCAHEDIVDVYSKDFQRTIAILSGEFIIKGQNFVDQNRSIYWQMALALHLWFANSSSDSISTIVQDFETAYHEHFWLQPIAHYGNTKSLDLRWKLLKLYTDDAYATDQVFDVSSYSSNPFDYRLCWMLYITLQSLGKAPLDVEYDTSLHVNFAQQLEQLGYWPLSIFVLLHIHQPTNREKWVKEYLNRHVTSDMDLTPDEQILLDKYNLPLPLVLSSKAQRAEYEKHWLHAVRLWIDAKQWRRAHDTFCNHVFHETLFKGDLEFAKNILDSLDHQRANISHWNRRGGFARQYIDLLITFENIKHGQISLTNRIHTNILTQVHRLCDQLSEVIAEKFFKKISLMDITRRLLSVINYAIICTHLANDTEENLSKKLNLFHQSILSSVPCSFPLELLLQQIELKTRSLRH